jgi:hypothetical protein
MAEIEPNDIPFLLGRQDRVSEQDGKPTTAFLDWLQGTWSWMKRSVIDLTTKITTVTDSVGDIAAEVTVLQIAQADLEGAFASYQVTVTAQFGAVNAAITSESTARANADSAIATQISSLTATVNGNTAAITTEATARANGDSALASSISSLSTTVGTNTADIATEVSARSSADSALATSISTVDAKANNATASGQIFFGAKSAPTGATASYGMFLTAGSAFAGIEAIAKSGGGAAIGFTADKFVFIDAGNLQEVFTYIGSGRWVLNGSISFRSSVGTTTLEISNQGVFINDPSTSSSIELSIT